MSQPNHYRTHFSAESALLSAKELLALIGRQRDIVLMVTIFGTVAFGVTAMMLPPQYRSSAMLMVRQNVAHTPVAATADSEAVVSKATDYRSVEPEINGAVALLQSPDTVRDVLSSMNTGVIEEERGVFGAFVDLGKSLTIGAVKSAYRYVHDIPPPDALTKSVQNVLENLHVAPVEKSNLIEVVYVDKDRERSAEFVNTLLGAYLQPEVRKGSRKDTLGFYQSQRERLAEELVGTEAGLREFRVRTGADLTYEDEADIRARRSRLQTSISEASAEHAAFSARISKLTHELRTIPTQMGQPLEIRLIEARSERDSLSAKLAVLRKQLAQDTAKLERLDSVRAERTRLEAQVEMARAAFTTYSEKEEQARFSRAVDDANLANFSVARHAVVPSTPESGNGLVLALLGAIMSFGAGIAAAFVWEWLAPYLGREDEAVAANAAMFGQPACTDQGGLAE